VWRATASSRLKSGKADGPIHAPDNMRDGEDSTAPVQRHEGDGPREWLEFSSHTPVTVRELTLVADDNKSPETWLDNALLRWVRLHFSEHTRQDAGREAPHLRRPLRSKRRAPSSR